MKDVQATTGAPPSWWRVCARTAGIFGGTAALLVVLLAAARSPAADHTATLPAEFALTVLHTNDLHGHMFPFAYTEVGRGPLERPSVGGAARRATLIRRLRAESKNPVVLVDGGDTFTRGPLTNAYEGIADVEAMNAVGYELAAVGNNEFKAKDASERGDAAGAQSALLQVVKRARFPWLCANVTDAQGATLQGVQPYVVRQWEGVRVGFLGLTAPRSAEYPQTRGWRFVDPVVAAREWIPQARKQCDVLIAVTHIGVPLDRKLASETAGLVAIVGGDSHTFLYEAVEVPNQQGVRVPIVQDGEFGVNLGRFDLRFTRKDDRWSLSGYKYQLLPVGPELEDAADVAARLEPYVLPFRPVVGHLASIPPTAQERRVQTTRVLVDALRRETGADIALSPSGSIAQDVFHTTTVTRLDVYAAFPFKDRMVTATLTGAEIDALVKLRSDTVLSGPAQREAARAYRVALIEAAARDAYKLDAGRLQLGQVDPREAICHSLSKP